MTGHEIAETLLNGNIADARREILDAGAHKAGPKVYHAAITALDVASELAPMLNLYSEGENYAAAIVRVRRCLEGSA